MWLSVDIRGSVTRSRSVAQQVVSTTKELSSWGKWYRRQTEDVLLSLMIFVFEFRYGPRRNEGRHDYYFFFFCRKHPRRKRISHVRYLGSQRSMLGEFTSYCFTRIGQRGMWYGCMIITIFWDEICLPSNKWSKRERGMFLPSNKSPAHFMMSPTLRNGTKIRFSNTTEYTRARKEYEWYSCVKQSLHLYTYLFWPVCLSAYWGSEPRSHPFEGQIYISLKRYIMNQRDYTWCMCMI